MKTLSIVFGNLVAGNLSKILISRMQETKTMPVIHEEAIKTRCNSVEIYCYFCFLFADRV